MKAVVILDPDEVLKNLKAGAKSPRTVMSLDIIYQICKEQHERGSNDFSYSTVGKLSEGKGGPKAQPIRNASGAVYRTLIDTWANYVEGRTRSAQVRHTQSLEHDVLALINDSVARILVENIISQSKKLKYENQVLKIAAKDKIVIDLSGYANSNPDPVDVFTPLSFLLDQEQAALRNAISQETMRKHGWTLNETTGAVTRGPLPIFSPGFASAIKKILNSIDGT
ncbi:MAG: gamma-mobile-trio protein GmtX [Burkholderiaceae bacterium]